jgi:hypothetical protein
VSLYTIDSIDELREALQRQLQDGRFLRPRDARGLDLVGTPGFERSNTGATGSSESPSPTQFIAGSPDSPSRSDEPLESPRSRKNAPGPRKRA